MAQGQISLKRIGVDKTNSRIVGIAAGAAFLTVFFLVASVTLVQQLLYQNKVIGQKKQAVHQLQANITASNSLISSYNQFVNAPLNLLGGNPGGTGAKDGSNAKLILDALPSKYDFPGLTSSLEKVLTDQHVKIDSMTGTDDEVAQSANASSDNPQPIAMPFEFSVSGDYLAIQNVISAMDHSIRPMQIQTTEITGDQTDLTLKLTGQTFYQPEKSLSITKEVVK